MRDPNCICQGMYLNLDDCPVHTDGCKGCTCQYRATTPKWYITVKTCPIHAETYNPMQAPAWAATQCGDGGAEVWRDRETEVARQRMNEETRWSWDEDKLEPCVGYMVVTKPDAFAPVEGFDPSVFPEFLHQVNPRVGDILHITIVGSSTTTPEASPKPSLPSPFPRLETQSDQRVCENPTVTGLVRFVLATQTAAAAVLVVWSPAEMPWLWRAALLALAVVGSLILFAELVGSGDRA